MSRRGNRGAIEQRAVSPIQAANKVIDAETKLSEMELPSGLSGDLIHNIHGAIAYRGNLGLKVDVFSREEVSGLVNAAMAGFDHLQDVRKNLVMYTIGLLQTDDFSLTLAWEAGITQESAEITGGAEAIQQ